jgi:CelD/BcsL family acetyltransferase involved in cellulose biosynthesis
MSALRTDTITSFKSLESLAPDWERLWRLSARRDIFGTFGWARAWWRAYGSGSQLRALTVVDSGRIVGLLPLVSDGRHLRLLGTPTSDYNDLLCEPREDCAILEAALRGILGLVSCNGRCTLESLPEDSNIVSQYRRLATPIRRQLHLSRTAPCPRVVFHPGPDNPLPTLLRKKSLRRHENALRQLGEVRFRHLEDCNEIQRHLPVFFGQHMARRAMAGGTSIFSDQRERNFYGYLLEELNPRKELRFAVLELDGRPVAYHFGFEVDRVFVWYKPAFDPELSRFSPGEVLIKRLLEYAGTHGLRVFDFTVGDETFKNRFANVTYHNYALYVFPRNLPGRANRSYCQAKDYLKRHPRAYFAIKTGIMMVQKLPRKVAARGDSGPGLGGRLETWGKEAGCIAKSIRTKNPLVRLIRFAQSYGTMRALYWATSSAIQSLPLKNWIRLQVSEVFVGLASDLKCRERLPKSFTVRLAEKQDLRALESFSSMPERVSGRWCRGDVCILCLVDGKIGAAQWLALGPKEFDDDRNALRCTWRVSHGMSFNYGAEGKMLGAYGALCLRMAGFMKELGISTCFSHIDYANWESLKAANSLGCVSLGLVVHMAVAGFGFSLYRPWGGKWRSLPGRLGELELLYAGP